MTIVSEISGRSWYAIAQTAMQGFTPEVPSDEELACSPSSAGPASHMPLFSGLDAAECEALFASMAREHIQANQTVFWMGDEGDSLYVVERGSVVVTVPNERGEHVALNAIGPGGFFGEISLLDAGPRTATVRALEPTDLYVLTRHDFHAFLRRCPEAAIEILGVMGQRQRASTEALRGLKNPNTAFDLMRITTWQRVSDFVARGAAGKAFTVFHVAWFAGWIVWNLLAGAGWIPRALAFDPFPFGLLTMVVSLEAIFLAICVLVSQNRQAEKDRLAFDLDYQVNLKAQTEIVSFARRLDRIEHLLTAAREPAEEPIEAKRRGVA